MRIFRLLALISVVALLLSFSGLALAAPPTDIPGNGPPNLEKITFIHYAKDFPAGNPHGGKPGGGDEKLWYKYSGLHWGSTPEYRINDADHPDYFSGNFVNAIQDSFAIWIDAPGSFAVDYQGSTTVAPNTLVIDPTWGIEVPDRQNVVGWLNLGNTNVIGATYIWYNSLTKHLVDVDTALNSNSAYHWWLNSTADEIWDYTDDIYAYDVDVQNIMTHEAGHWLVLDDLYKKPAGEQTMYGISSQFELKKCSLESGDKAGILVIYP
jgi:hypothetical protein